MYPNPLDEPKSYVPLTQQWLRSLVFFKGEAEGRIMAAQDQYIPTNAYRL